MDIKYLSNKQLLDLYFSKRIGLMNGHSIMSMYHYYHDVDELRAENKLMEEIEKEILSRMIQPNIIKIKVG